uniref:Uncharacterized protein n=1 Tax=viral metagenome TaxID=1070528 RepID=A0A6M3LNM0_9ZZZZ
MCHDCQSIHLYPAILKYLNSHVNRHYHLSLNSRATLHCRKCRLSHEFLSSRKFQRSRKYHVFPLIQQNHLCQKFRLNHDYLPNHSFLKYPKYPPPYCLSRKFLPNPWTPMTRKCRYCPPNQ